MKKLKTWAEVFPQGTKEGDEEQRFFIALSRHPKFDWRSTKAIMKESNLNEGRVEEIIEKYLDMGLIFGSDSREDHWAYWERVPDLLKKDLRSISKKDKDGNVVFPVCTSCSSYENSKGGQIKSIQNMKKVVITGVSTGIGYASAKLLCNSGYIVYGSVRTNEDAERIASELGENLLKGKSKKFDVACSLRKNNLQENLQPQIIVHDAILMTN